MEKSGGKVVLAIAAVATSLFLLVAVTAIALAMRASGEPSVRERCERSGGIWHDSAGHGASAPHCMGGAADRASFDDRGNG